MKIAEAEAWIAFATKLSLEEVAALHLAKTTASKIGQKLSENKLLNPPKERHLKTIIFKCACPCGQVCTRTYKTKKPKYINDAHKQRAQREGAQESGINTDKPVFCTTCMIVPVVSTTSLIEAEKHTCWQCLEKIL